MSKILRCDFWQPNAGDQQPASMNALPKAYGHGNLVSGSSVIRKSINITSMDYGSTGQHSMQITNVFVDDQYGASIGGSTTSTGIGTMSVDGPDAYDRTTSYINFKSTNGTSFADILSSMIVLYGELAA